MASNSSSTFFTHLSPAAIATNSGAMAEVDGRTIMDKAPLGALVEPFEIEQGTTIIGDSGSPTARQVTRCTIFPLNLCCCPLFIPNAWRTFQDATHLILVIGVIANVVMLATIVSKLLKALPEEKCHSHLCINEGICIAFSLPCTLYFVGIIGRYDERLQAKQHAAKLQRAKLTSELEHTINDMEGLLSRSAESSAGLAEQSFESKRRDFVRFLERVQDRSQLLSTEHLLTKDAHDIVTQLRRFVRNWLKVFEESSIDPVQHPRTVCTVDELDRCKTVGEICALALERLEHIEISFISKQQEEDSKLMSNKRAMVNRASAILDPASFQGSFTRTPSQPGRSTKDSWLYASSDIQFAFKKSQYDEYDGYFPMEFKFCCCTLHLLSKEHCMLLMAFLGAVTIMCKLTIGLDARQLVDEHSEHRAHLLNVSPLLIEVAIDVVCLIVVLVRFQDLDVIQQLEQEVRRLKETTDEVDRQHSKMNEFWGNAMELSELWLYRTVPRLDLYKEIHQHIEDSTEAKNLSLNSSPAQYLALVNQRLEDMEANLGQLEAWREHGKYSVAEKKRFMQAMNGICRKKDKEQMVDMLGASIENKKACDSWGEASKTPSNKDDSAAKTFGLAIADKTGRMMDRIRDPSPAPSPRGRSPGARPKG